MQEQCQMTFRTSTGRNRVVAVNDPRVGLTEANVRAAANMFIAANPFNEETGALVELLSAQRVSVSRDVVIAPPDAV